MFCKEKVTPKTVNLELVYCKRDLGFTVREFEIDFSRVFLCTRRVSNSTWISALEFAVLPKLSDQDSDSSLIPSPTDGRKSLRPLAKPNYSCIWRCAWVWPAVAGHSQSSQPIMELGHRMTRTRSRLDQAGNPSSTENIQTPHRAGKPSPARNDFAPAERAFEVYSCCNGCCSVAGCSVCASSRCV